MIVNHTPSVIIIEAHVCVMGILNRETEHLDKVRSLCVWGYVVSDCDTVKLLAWSSDASPAIPGLGSKEVFELGSVSPQIKFSDDSTIIPEGYLIWNYSIPLEDLREPFPFEDKLFLRCVAMDNSGQVIEYSAEKEAIIKSSGMG